MQPTKKVCVITGANAGIGKAAAIQISQQGFRVVMACRNKKRGEAALREVRAESGSDDVLLLELDMALQSSIRNFVKNLAAYTATVDVLVHNAAAFDLAQKTPHFTEEKVESIWATNHVGCVFLTHLLLEKLQRSEQGRVITVASQGLMLHPFLKVDLDDPEFKQRKSAFPKPITSPSWLR